jgi:hypothetical protein
MNFDKIQINTNQIALSESDSRKTLHLDSQTCASAGNDNADFGSMLQKNNDVYYFKKKYLRISFFVECNVGEFFNPKILEFKINGINVFSEGITRNTDAVMSRDQTAIGVVTIKDPRVLVHVNVPTIKIYNQTIKTIYCKCEYGAAVSRKTISGTWDL